MDDLVLEWLKGDGGSGDVGSTVVSPTAVDVDNIDGRILDKLVSMGFERRFIIVFDLPTEYRNASVSVKRENGVYKEVRVFSGDPSVYRTLRSSFYNVLNRVAYRTRLGWVLSPFAPVDELQRLRSVVSNLNSLAGTERVVEVVELLVPRVFLVSELDRFIHVKKLSLEELKKKYVELKEEEKEKKKQLKRIEYESRKLEEQLKLLEKELKHLVGGGEK